MTTMRTDELVDALTKALKEEQMGKGFSSASATSFTLGYLNSFMSSVIMSLPKTQQKRINDELVARIINR